MARLKVISIVLVALDKVLIRANSFFPNNTMETFSILLDHALHLGLIKTPFKEGTTTISHALFADDFMVFPGPDIVSVTTFKSIFIQRENYRAR